MCVCVSPLHPCSPRTNPPPTAAPAERAPQDLAARGHPSRHCDEDSGCGPEQGWQVRAGAQQSGWELSRLSSPRHFQPRPEDARATFVPQGLGIPRPWLTFWNLMSSLCVPWLCTSWGARVSLGNWGFRAISGFLPVVLYLPAGIPRNSANMSCDAGCLGHLGKPRSQPCDIGVWLQ